MAISEEAQEASRRGRALQPNEGIQVAGGRGGVLIDILRALDVIPSDSSKGVPTSVEERRLPQAKLGEPDPYRERQKELAPKLLSEEGQKRFDEAGGVASEAIRPPANQQALDTLGPDDLTRSEAQKSTYGIDAETMMPRVGESGAADTGDAKRVFESTDPDAVGQFVQSGAEGIDFNFSKLNTGNDVKAMINEISEIYADPIKASKRGIVTQKETEAEAFNLLEDELGFVRGLLKRKSGKMLNAAQATASRIVLSRSGERLLDLAKRIRNGEDGTETLLQFRRQMSIHAGIQMQVKGMQTEIARALNAFNIPASARAGEDIADLAAAMLRETGGRSEAIKLARGLVKAEENGGKAGMHKYALGSFASKANGMFQEFYVNGLLSWTYTHIKNFVATPLFMVMQTGEELLAGIYGGLERGAGRAIAKATGINMDKGFGRLGLGATADGVYAGSVAMRYFAWMRTFKDAWITGAESFRTGQAADPLNKIEGSQHRQIDAENIGISNQNAGKFVDEFGRAINIPSRLLIGADDLWRVTTQRGELYAEAYREAMIAKSLGKSDKEAFDNFAMAILDPRSYANQLDEAARYNTLTTDLGKIGELAAIIQKFPVLGRIMMPFTKAPSNGILRTAERFGLTFDFAKDPVKRQKAMARATMGWGAANLIAGYAVDGRITGAMPSDERQRNMLPPGWRPYSFVLKGDNWPKDEDGDDKPIYDRTTGVPNGPLTYVSYAGLEPVGAIVGVTATAVEIMRRTNNPVLRDNIAAASIAASMQYISDMPMLRTIGDIADMFERGPAQILSGPLGSILPYSAAIRAGERMSDPTIRRASGSENYYTLEDVQKMEVGTDGKVRYELVGMPKGKGTLEFSFEDAMTQWKSMLKDRELFGGASDETSAIQYDVFGKPRESNVRFDTNPILAVYNMIIPFNIRKGAAPTSLEREQIRLQGPLRTARQKAKGFVFSEAFQAEWTRQAKAQIKTRNPATGKAEGFMEALSNLVSSGNYAGMTDKEQFDAIRDVEDRFYDSALDVVFATDRYASVGRSYRDFIYTRDLMKSQGRIVR